MRIDISLRAGKKMEAKLGEHIIFSDQGVNNGGEDSAPDPFSYFLASLVMCAGHYIRSFCEKRGISLEGIKIHQDYLKIDEENPKRKMVINIELPEGFPEKYKKAVIASVNGCSVKKVVQEGADFEVVIN